MELTVRDWMVIVGVLLIIAVLLDAYRRVRSERRNGVRVSLVNQGEEEGADDDLHLFRELPNGGARVVQRSDLVKAARDNQAKANEAADAAAAARSSQPRVRTRDAVEAVLDGAAGSDDKPDDEADELLAGISSSDPVENLDWLDGIESADRDTAPAEEEAGRLPRDLDPQVFMLNVVARNPRGFNGEDILQILLACDLRFGDMSFFHRHEFEAGKGAIQFSVANMMQPGVFDIDNMSELHTPGLVFFLTLPGPEDMMQAFDYMLETAQAVARNLEGDVLDETRSAVTRQNLEHARSQIRELERRMLTQAAR